MLLWKIFFPVLICLFGCNRGSGELTQSQAANILPPSPEFIVQPNDGKIRYFRGFQTDEFHFKLRNDAKSVKNTSHIYLLDNLDAHTNYGRYMRISLRYDFHNTTWLNIYSSNSGLAASERTAKFKEKPDKDGFRGYWIRRQRHSSYGRPNRWEFGQEWDNVHPIMKLQLKFPFFPQYFALEGFSTWKLEQILIGRRPSTFGFFSSADLSMVHMPTFFPAMAKIIPSKTDAPNTRTPESFAKKFLKFSRREVSQSTQNTILSPSTTKGIPVSNNYSTSITESSSSAFGLPAEKKSDYFKHLKFKRRTLFPKSNQSQIEIKLPNITFPKITTPHIKFPNFSIPKIILPNITIPKIDLPLVSLSSVTAPKITIPESITVPIIPFPNVTFTNTVEFPLVTLLPKLHSSNVTSILRKKLTN